LTINFRKLYQPIAHKSAKFNAENHAFHKMFFSAAFVQKRQPYGRQFSLPITFFFRPDLSYFAEFSAGWQQCFPVPIYLSGAPTETHHGSASIRAS
jgi:hypothetical protein